MAEQSLYRRHRPQSFAEVVGQEHVVRTLSNAIERDRVHHAYLFVGSRGTGKTSMAKILAKSLNCVNGPTLTPCGECESCVSIAAGGSMDVIEMDAASNRSVDDIRELRERVSYAPSGGHWKVYILDEAHMLTKEAWNAFLKTLEEPPPHTVFVLATTEAHKVMPTIADRCQRFDFQRPSLEELAEVLRRVSAAEGIEISDGAVAMIARSASGSFRDALGTLDQLVSFGGERSVDLDAVLEMLGAADADLLFEAVDAVAAEDPRAVLEAIGKVASSGHDPVQFARDLLAHLRQLLVVQTIGEVPESFLLTAADSERLRAQAPAVGAATLVRTIDELADALAAVREGDDARLAVEVSLLKAARPELDASAEGLARRVERLERRSEGQGVVPAGTEPAEPRPPSEGAVGGKDEGEAEPEAGGPAPPVAASGRASAGGSVGGELDLDKLNRLWPAVLDQVRQSGSAMLSALFEGTRPVALDREESVLRVGFPSTATFNKRKAEAVEQRERFAEALRSIAGAHLRPVYVLLDGEAHPAPAEKELDEDELLEKLKSEFDAEEVS
ncbi:MAG: DNA polymerase III subunit gamma/tau [Solirubrobacterales bacterium]